MGRGGSGNWRDQRMCQKAFWAKVCIKILIILHAGSCKRWINGGELVFQSKKSGDYHDEMTSEHFEVLFNDTLTHLRTSVTAFVTNNYPTCGRASQCL